MESPLKKLLIPSLFKNAGITWLRKQEFGEAPTTFPIHFVDKPVKNEYTLAEQKWPATPTKSGPGFQFATIYDYARSYKAGQITPESVARKVLEAIESSEANDPPLRAFIAVSSEDLLRQAKESAERIKNGNPLSLLDGVPVAIKDELDMKPFPTSVGTSFLGKNPVTDDATVVARLRAAGALLIGKTNMHEIGLGVTGFNPHHGTPCNPYNPNYYTGGSSSGPAASVAAGFCLEGKGAKLREISIPDLEAGRVAHVVTIVSEMVLAHDSLYKKHRSDYSLEMRINLALARQFSAKDYIKAQQVRTLMINNFNRVLQNVDMIITPTNGISAPVIKKTAFPNGDSDLTTLTEIMRFVFPANLTGLPAISFPAGYGKTGMPVGLQAMGRAWQEQTLFRVAMAAEQVVERKKPQVHYEILQ